MLSCGGDAVRRAAGACARCRCVRWPGRRPIAGFYGHGNSHRTGHGHEGRFSIAVAAAHAGRNTDGDPGALSGVYAGKLAAA